MLLRQVFPFWHPILVLSRPPHHCRFWKSGLWEAEQMPGKSEPSSSNRRSTRGDSRVIRSLYDIHRIYSQSVGGNHSVVVRCSSSVSTSRRCMSPSGWRWHLEGESWLVDWPPDGRLVDRESLPDPASDVVFSVSVAHDRSTAQVSKSFSFVDALLANEYWDIWSRVANNVHDLHLGHTNSKPRSSSLTVHCPTTVLTAVLGLVYFSA